MSFLKQQNLLHSAFKIRKVSKFSPRYISSSTSLKSNEPAGAGTSTGIEHALKFNEVGNAKHKQNFEKDYKCIEYLNYSKFSFYDPELEMQKYRAEQPSNTRPDNEPRFKNIAEPQQKVCDREDKSKA
ncbi:NADH dehydrogenase [ubiquinone] flavoprotein 3, mitochondrial domain-containing protein [Ditylenchus destructor]|uniref:NADH dehydrogenase [ubiquinone] flavoprotein 3, mitochondrial domain-containing protein n=1 Tax=Ditylenchus destructor TaxID=166010 RepID=A0AAD4NA22_9BILA|nr:NADH dehydrogenase [ubiquinone] flavoprotein 3, mitochondrial domain-containing protein [Ditylenchus destructor]